MIVFDIETIANERASEYFDKHYKVKTGNRKDPEKIKEYVEAQKAEARKKAGLHWWTGQVVAICAWCNVTDDSFKKVDADEARLLLDFRDFIATAHHFSSNRSLIGKSSKDFDAPFLIGRYMANGIRPHAMFKSVEDIDHFFSHSRSNSQVTSLANYAWGLGLDGKLEDSSKVQELWDTGHHQVILEHCWRDVEITRDVIRLYEVGKVE